MKRRDFLKATLSMVALTAVPLPLSNIVKGVRGCRILDEFNVSEVVCTGVGNYTVYFKDEYPEAKMIDTTHITRTQTAWVNFIGDQPPELIEIEA